MTVDPNIQKKANDIRTKTYGKEVRESLASGLEEMSKDIEETKRRQDELEGQFQTVLDETTGKDVISAPEILAARVSAEGTNHNNLKERLDKEHQEVTSQLAQIHAEKASKKELEQNKTELQTYIDNQLDQLDGLSLRGAFATLEELNTAFPNGAEGIYVVQADGHWYYWDGANWSDGGIYQAMPWDAFMTVEYEPWEV